MIAVVFLLGLGLLLVGLLGKLLLRRSLAEATPLESLDSDPAEYLVEAPEELIERLFGSDDWNFVRAQSLKGLPDLFIRQRRPLALSWMRDLRRRTRRLLELHRIAARTAPQLQPTAEFTIFADYVFFEIAWQLTALAVCLRGPVAMNHAVTRIGGLSRRVADATALIDLVAERETSHARR